MPDPFDDDDSDLPDDDSDTDVIDDDDEIIGDVTYPVPVTVTDSTNSFIRDMSKGKQPQPLKKQPAYCPECGAEMHLCARCASGKVCTGEP